MPIPILTRKAGAGKIASNVTTLSISWLNSHFAALAIHRGVVAGTWERAVTAEDVADFAGLIREAVQKTNYHGTTVSLLLASPQMAQQLVDVPPVTGSDLKKVIQREVQQQQLFSGEAAWIFQSSLTSKGVQRVILHLLPKTLLDQLVQACRQNGLHLNSVVPVSAVLHQQLARLPLNKDDVALLAAETGGCTTVVVGRADGQLLLIRTLLGDWNENAERLALDLKRTTAFTTQQYGLQINRGVWLFGPNAAAQARTLQRQIETPVAVSPVESQPAYWAGESAKLRPAISPNFIGLELQQAPQRRVFAKVVAASTGLVVLAALAGAMLMHLQARQEAANIEILRQRAGQLQVQRRELAQRNTDLAGKEQWLKRVMDDPLPPVPAWLLGYLSEAVPADLVVTNLHVKQESNSWKLQMAGTLQATGQPAAPATLTNAVGLLADRLATSPFHLTILKRSDREYPASEKAGGSGSRPSRTGSPPVMTNQFLIEGVMR